MMFWLGFGAGLICGIALVCVIWAFWLRRILGFLGKRLPPSKTYVFIKQLRQRWQKV